MNSFDDIRRQLRIALIAILVILPTGVAGFRLLEKDMSWLDALWVTITTLTTIGYGDIVATTPQGRMFTIVLILFGLGAYAMAAQAAVQFFTSPAMRDIRQRRWAERKINDLRNHYVICGEGELVDKTVSYLLQRAEMRRQHQSEAIAAPVDRWLEQLLGKQQHGGRSILRRAIRSATLFFLRFLHRGQTLLDVIVVVTKDVDYADHLRDNGLLVVEEDPTDDLALRRAGIGHAQAMMSMLESDTETLLNVLTAHNRNLNLYITAATQQDEIGLKMARVGANTVLAPYDVAGQFLNNATLRPAVNDYFNSILFDQHASSQIIQLYLWDDALWIGQRLGDLDLRKRFEAAVIGLRLEDGHYLYVPPEDHVLQTNEVVLAVTPGPSIPQLQQYWYDGAPATAYTPNWQKLPSKRIQQTSETRYSLMEAEEAIRDMSHHFVVCGSGPVIRNALDKLDPERPFVVISGDNELVSEMAKRGFRVIHGNPAQEQTLLRAGVERALAIMVSMEDKADSVLTILNSRSLSKRLLITATASTDDMIPRLRRAGADRVVSPFRIAAQFVLLATTQPVVSDFMQYVIFNYQHRIETTELYMQDNSPWIGKSITELKLRETYQAGVVGVRMADGRFIHAPPESYIIQPYEVLIVITPMDHSDELRIVAHGSETKRPTTLRQAELTSSGY